MTSESRQRRELMKGLAALGLAGVGSGKASAQGSARTSADLAGGKIVFENDKLRVVSHAARPRLGVCGTGVHTHPPHLTVFITDAKARVTMAGKEPFLAENMAGDLFWDPGGPHTVENLGSRSTKVYLVELKT